jgi:ubiquinone/menaquinone biosynthesis C-methylase UbiE
LDKPIEGTSLAAAHYDAESVRRLFDEMASTYGRVNLISSFGFTIRWRHQVVADLPLGSASCVVDLMSGMGELWRSLEPHLPASARLVGVDFSEQMAHRTPKEWPFSVEMRIADALGANAAPMDADVVVSSFGLKTFSRHQQGVLARRVAEILRPGGAYSFIEISVPRGFLLRTVYMLYLRRVIPLVGRLLLGNPACYRMLGVYTEAFGDTSHFAECLRQEGLEVTETSFFFGCATGVRGIRPVSVRPGA